MKLRAAATNLFVAASLLGGCAATATRASSQTAAATNVSNAGDLPPAVPTAEAPSDHANTGSPARIVLGARRERAVEAFTRLLRAMSRRDLETIGSMLDTVVYDIDSGESYPRESVLTDFESLLSRIDPNQLAASLPNLRPTVRSAAEMRRLGRTFRFSVLPDDWFIDAPMRMQMQSLANPQIPRTVMVRFVGDEPYIAGFARTRYR